MGQKVRPQGVLAGARTLSEKSSLAAPAEGLRKPTAPEEKGLPTPPLPRQSSPRLALWSWPLETVLQPGAPPGAKVPQEDGTPLRQPPHPAGSGQPSHTCPHTWPRGRRSPLTLEQRRGQGGAPHSPLLVAEFSGPQIKPPGVDHYLICDLMDSCETF